MLDLQIESAHQSETAKAAAAESVIVTDCWHAGSSMPPRPLVYSSDELLKGQREAWIEHGDQMYRLRLTHAGKLYLTK